MVSETVIQEGSLLLFYTDGITEPENSFGEEFGEARLLDVAKRMLNDRNERWVPVIQELVRGGKNVMIIVGAGHLVGDKGVVELLKKKGFKVTQQ